MIQVTTISVPSMDITYNTVIQKIETVFFFPLFKCLYKQMHQNQNSKLIMPNPKDKKENSCVLNGRIFYWIREKVYFFLNSKFLLLAVWPVTGV